MVDTTDTNGSREPPQPLSAKAGVPEELLRNIERTIMGFRLEDFDRAELRQCALAVLEVCHSFRHRSPVAKPVAKPVVEVPAPFKPTPVPIAM
jgi:hypothetical protein